MYRLIAASLVCLPLCAVAQPSNNPWPGECASGVPSSALGCFPQGATPVATDLIYTWQVGQSPHARAAQVQQILNASLPATFTTVGATAITAVSEALSATTQSTSPTVGALTVAGGVGVLKHVAIGDTSAWLPGALSYITNTLPALPQAATLAVAGLVGDDAAILGMSHTLNGQTIGIDGFVLNDATAAIQIGGWGGYVEAQLSATAYASDYIHAFEADPVQFQAASADLTPYTAAQGEGGEASGMRTACGGGHPLVSNCNLAFSVANNGAKFRTGLMMYHGSLVGDGSASPGGEALALARFHYINWYAPNGQVAASIGSARSSSSGPFTLTFNDGNLAMINGFLSAQVAGGAGTYGAAFKAYSGGGDVIVDISTDASGGLLGPEGAQDMTITSNGAKILKNCTTGAIIATATTACPGSTSHSFFADGSLQTGAASGILNMAVGEIGMSKIAASGTAPGATGAKLGVVCGTGAGTIKLIAYAGTSATPTTVIDNVGGGVTGC